MSLSTSLDRLVEQSTRAAAVQIATPTFETEQQRAGSKRSLIRDAETNECRLFAVSTGESLSARFQADLQSAQSLTRILSSANTLNQLCNRPELKARIEGLAQRHEIHLMNKEYFQLTLKKHEEEASRQNASTHKRGRAEEREPEAAALRRYEREIHEIQDELEAKSSTLAHQQNEMQRLEACIATQKRQLQDQEANRKVTASARQGRHQEASRPATMSQTRTPHASSIYDELYQQLTTLQDAAPGQAHLDATECSELVTLLEQASDTLQDIQDEMHKLQSSSERHNLITHLQQRLLTHVLSDPPTLSPDTIQSVASLFPEETLEVYQPPAQAKVIAKLLETLGKEQSKDGMPLAALKDRVSPFACSLGLDDKATTQAIYNLVAKNTILIDRSTKNSLVKLVLNNME